jgi:hydroxymethylpyrimidine pyrophosphatase-like HAD family hydrolase
MRYQAVATDFDGTLTTDGRLQQSTFECLQRLVESGRRLVLVTGRQLYDLQQVFPRHDIFDLIVAENGAVLYDPAIGREEILCEPVSNAFLGLLLSHGVQASAGHAIIGAQSADLEVVHRAIQESGLDLQMILNKDSLMILPMGVTKATGLERALAELALSRDRVIAIGDAENDCDLFAACGRAVAVANALSAVKSRAHLVTSGAGGAGVCEVIGHLLAFDRLPCDNVCASAPLDAES